MGVQFETLRGRKNLLLISIVCKRHRVDLSGLLLPRLAEILPGGNKGPGSLILLTPMGVCHAVRWDARKYVRGRPSLSRRILGSLRTCDYCCKREQHLC